MLVLARRERRIFASRQQLISALGGRSEKLCSTKSGALWGLDHLLYKSKEVPFFCLGIEERLV